MGKTKEGKEREKREWGEEIRGWGGGKSEHDAIVCKTETSTNHQEACNKLQRAFFKRVRNVITLLETGCGQHRHNSMSYIGGYTSVSSHS